MGAGPVLVFKKPTSLTNYKDPKPRIPTVESPKISELQKTFENPEVLANSNVLKNHEGPTRGVREGREG